MIFQPQKIELEIPEERDIARLWWLIQDMPEHEVLFVLEIAEELAKDRERASELHGQSEIHPACDFDALARHATHGTTEILP